MLIGEMPFTGVRSRHFDLDHAQQLTPTGEVGFIQTINRTAPFWLAEYETAPLDDEKYNEWTVFFDQLEGSMNSFLAFDPRRPMPWEYRTQTIMADPWKAAGHPWPAISAYDYAASTISIHHALDGAVITRGDYGAVQILNTWYLFRFQENRTVAVGGTASNILVKPRPNFPLQDWVDAAAAAGADGVPVRYRKAPIEMKMVGKREELNTEVGALPQFRFRAVQFTNRIPT